MTNSAPPAADSGASPPPTPGPLPAAPFWMTFVNFLVPGSGFCMAGRWTRGGLQAALVLTTAAVGWLLHGGVTWPSWSPRAIDFNLLNILTFLVQLGGGGPALLSLAAQQRGFEALGGIPQAPYFELGSYYLVVAGAVNYFATLNFHDRLVRRSPRFRDQENEAGGGLV